MRRTIIALVLVLGTAFGQSARAQAPFQTEIGRLCLEAWITRALQQLNSYSGTTEFNLRKPWRVNRFGFIFGEGMRSNYEPDNWVQFGASRDAYMWNFQYTSELQYPVWPNPNFNGARVPGMRYFVRRCIEGATPPATPSGGGSTTTGSSGTGTGTTTGTTGSGTGTATATPPSTGGTNPPGITVPANAACPPTLAVIGPYPGVVLGCTCGPNRMTGTVWGSGPYTSDSSLCNAARHAGAIPASGGTVWATITAGSPSYSGTTRFGVTTQDFGRYGASTVILNALPGRTGAPQIKACPGNMNGRTGTLTCHCAPARFSSGNVWGTGIYTNDSDLCRAALHAGVVSPGGGPVTVRSLPDAGSYTGTTSNGVTSADYGAWQGAMEFPR